MRFALPLALLLLTRFCFAQTNAAPATAEPPTPAATTSDLQKAVNQLTQSNRDLLELLKKQQAVLQDMQYDRRLQSRQIESLEERLTSSQLENSQLQNKVSNLENEAAAHPAVSLPPKATDTTNGQIAPAPPATNAVSAPPPPSTYLPAPPPEIPSGSMSWHRLFTLKGTDNKQSDLFHIQSRTWRVLWHNQDQPGKTYVNTSALFINAFPKDDTIPQKVCSKLGSGGDSTELDGPGNYYLKIEGFGGSWELAVEDFH